MLKTRIEDGFGSGTKVRVSPEGQLNVVVHPHPPQGEQISALPVREFFTNAGSNDMKVDGSSSEVRFTIEADATKDKYIKTISFLISDASATLSEFGNLNSALANGCKLSWQSQEEGEIVISDQLTTNFEFVRLCVGNPSFGDSAGSFRASNITSTSEGFLPVLDVSSVFGLPFGFRLRAGTTDKLVLTIRDNVTGVDQFDAIAYGLKI
jgi:hypothetical protein